MRNVRSPSKVTVSPRVGALLTQVTDLPDLEAALWKVLSEYIELKMESIREEIRAFESKWGMKFDEFAERCEEGTLQADPYAYDVESDYWEWEAAETLLQHYERLEARWT